MGLFSFIKEAGAKLFSGSETPEEQAQKVKDEVAKTTGVDISKVTFSVAGDTVTLTGEVQNFDAKQKVLATAVNVEGIKSVDDNLTLTEPLAFSIPDLSQTFYTVKSGDNLSKISKEVYGDPNKYNTIFEANKPMLVHPDKIYVGQVLFIPPTV